MKWVGLMIFGLALALLPSRARADTALVLPAGCAPATLYTSGQQSLTMAKDGTLCVNATVTANATVTVAPLTSTNLSGTITVTNTFQSIQVLTAGRKGCTVQNHGTNSQYVFFGAIGSATVNTAYILAPGASVLCAVGGLGSLTDQISITGTAGDVFFAAVQ